MGHYTPQAHLKRFEADEQPEFVWMYDKVKRSFTTVHVSKVAQAPHYYPPDVEQSLNLNIEIPGNGAIRKIVSQEPLKEKERIDLSAYCSTCGLEDHDKDRALKKSQINCCPKLWKKHAES